MPNIKGNTGLTKKSRHSGMMREPTTTVKTSRPSLNLHSQELAPGEKQELAQGESAQRTNQESTQEGNQESAQRGHHESVLSNLEGNTRRLTLQKVIHGG